MTALQLIFRSNISDNNPNEWITAPLNFVGKYAAGNPNGNDLIMDRQDGIVRIWNKYWAFGGGQPTEDELTYVYPNPYNQNEHTDINFQFFMEQAGDVKISIYNINGQKWQQSLKNQFKKVYITSSLMIYHNQQTHNYILDIRT